MYSTGDPSKNIPAGEVPYFQDTVRMHTDAPVTASAFLMIKSVACPNLMLVHKITLVVCGAQTLSFASATRNIYYTYGVNLTEAGVTVDTSNWLINDTPFCAPKKIFLLNVGDTVENTPTSMASLSDATASPYAAKANDAEFTY